MKFRSFLSRLRIRPPAQHLLSALGVLSAGLLLAEINVLSSRNYLRLDLSEGQRFSLSQSTLDVVQQLPRDVELVVLLGAADPQLSEARQLLQNYQSLSNKLHVRYVDPDRDAAEFIALGTKFDIGTDPLTEGGVVANAAFLLKSAKRTWLVRADRLSQRDADGNIRSLMEQRLTEGLAQLQKNKKTTICFVAGHGERSLDDGAPEGLLELRRRLTRSNYSAKRIPLDVPDPKEAVSGCNTIAIVGPERPWPRAHENIMLDAWDRKVNFLLFLDPIVNEEGEIIPTGLERLAQKSGIIVKPQFVLEADPAHRLPQGLGEAFFAQPQQHALTRGLSTSSARVDARVLMIAASPLQKEENSLATSLLLASPQATAISNLAEQQSVGARSATAPTLSLAMAYDSQGKSHQNNQRTFVIGSSNVAWNRSFREPALYGNRLLVENAVSWVSHRPTLVSVPDKSSIGTQVRLTEESLGDLLRYVLVFMPLTAASAGLFFLSRRRKREESSRIQTGGLD